MNICNQCARKDTNQCLPCKWPNHESVPTLFVDKNIASAVKDEINKPLHYHKGGIDVIGYLEQHFGNKQYTVAEGFAIGNAIKYISRYKEKNGLKDLQKAEFYVKKLQEYENA